MHTHHNSLGDAAIWQAASNGGRFLVEGSLSLVSGRFLPLRHFFMVIMGLRCRIPGCTLEANFITEKLIF